MKSRNIFYKMFSPIVSILFFIIFLPKVKGRENIPKKKAAILAGNHKSNLDCFMVILSTRRCVHFLAKAELFKLSFLNWFFRNSGLIPVYRNGKDKKALETAVEYLKKIEEMIDFLVPVFSGEGRKMLIVAIGCTGGHHRSVTFANKLSDYVKTLGYTSSAVHRDIDI